MPNFANKRYNIQKLHKYYRSKKKFTYTTKKIKYYINYMLNSENFGNRISAYQKYD